MSGTVGMFKVWNCSRTLKKFVVAKSLDDLLLKANGKFGLMAERTDLRVVLESDGTDIDDDDQIAFLNKDNILMVLTSSQQWTAVDSTVVIYAENNAEAGKTAESAEEPRPAISQSVACSQSNEPPTNMKTCISSPPPVTVSCATMPLPNFSDYVKAMLQAGDSHLVWTKMVQESAFFYIAHNPQMGDKGSNVDYLAVGQAVYAAFPAIARDGKHPWSLFTAALSQKIRRIRWDNKRKSQASGSGPGQLPVPSPKRFRLQPSSDTEPVQSKDQYETHIKELAAEVTKKEPNHSHVKVLLQSSYRQRRAWIGKVPAGKLALILKTFPCFRQKEFIAIELRLMIQTTLPQLMKKFERIFESASSLMKKKKDGSKHTDCEVFRFIEEETSLKHGKGQKTKSVLQMTVVGNTNLEKALATAEESPPKLIALNKDGETINFAIVADANSFLLNTKETVEAVFLLISFYYVVDFEYPRIYSQVLGLFQHVGLGQPFEGTKSAGFIQLMKRLKID